MGCEPRGRGTISHPHRPSPRRKPGSSMLDEAAPAVMERPHRGCWAPAFAGVTAGGGKRWCHALVAPRPHGCTGRAWPSGDVKEQTGPRRLASLVYLVRDDNRLGLPGFLALSNASGGGTVNLPLRFSLRAPGPGAWDDSLPPPGSLPTNVRRASRRVGLMGGFYGSARERG